jgi:hypothetical protein
MTHGRKRWSGAYIIVWSDDTWEFFRCCRCGTLLNDQASRERGLDPERKGRAAIDAVRNVKDEERKKMVTRPMSSRQVSPDDPLVCVECGRDQADDERGWRSYLTDEEDEPAEAVVYCLRRVVPFRVVQKLASAVVMVLLLTGCGGDDSTSGGTPATLGETAESMEVRKQVYELTSADLERFPVWEFALDEEGEPGQDEATVKPRPDLAGGVEPEEGLFVVRAAFTAADGASFDGFVTPDSESDLGSTQPSVVTSGRHVRFWFGIAEPEPEEIEQGYKALGGQRDGLFPLSFRTSVPVGGAPMEGKVLGFMYQDESGEPRAAG